MPSPPTNRLSHRRNLDERRSLGAALDRQIDEIAGQKARPVFGRLAGQIIIADDFDRMPEDIISAIESGV